MFDPIRGSVWKSRVNSFIGLLFVGSFGLWALVVVMQAGWGINPLVNSFSAIIEKETQPALVP